MEKTALPTGDHAGQRPFSESERATTMFDKEGMLRALLLCLPAFIGLGCTHTQLRYNTVHQSLTVADIHQKQVLNNLAKFVHDPHAIPDFAYVNAGASAVADSGSLGFSVLWNWVGTDNNGLSGGAARAANESWTLTPVTDPRRLELMRCAFQRAVSSCYPNHESASCPNCTKLFNKFYTGKPYEKDKGGLPVLDETGEVASIVPPPWADKGAGIVNSECLRASCWFCVGRKEDLPANHHCIPWGHYCGIYVWVLPGRGTDELAKLTLAILDYAMNQPASLPTKNVVIEYEVDGSGNRHPKKITETFQTTTDDHLKKEGGGNGRAFTESLLGDGSGILVPTPTAPVPTPSPRGIDILQFEQQRRALTPFSP